MNKSFNPEDFESAIDAKDYVRIKNYIINSIRNNPGFRLEKDETISEASWAFKKVQKRKEELPGLFSAYELQKGEPEFDENHKQPWNQEYFVRQTFLLGENFCEERFRQVKKIGQYIAGNFENPQDKSIGISDERFNGLDVIDGKRRVNMLPWLMAIFIIIAIVAILVGKLAD